MAILKRRIRRPVFRRVKEFLWPTMGWMRTFNYFRHRMFRTGDSTYKITAGLAAGGAVSFNPFVGTHSVQALFLAWLLRANLVAAFIGTAAGNPWTFAVMFWASYTVGTWLCGFFGLSDFIAITFESSLIEDPLSFFRILFEHPLKLLLPMSLGGYLLGAVYWFAAYGLLYFPVRAARKAYQKRRLKRAYSLAAKRQGHPDVTPQAGGFIK